MDMTEIGRVETGPLDMNRGYLKHVLRLTKLSKGKNLKVKENEIKRRPRYSQTQTINRGRGRGGEDRDGERGERGRSENNTVYSSTHFSLAC